MQAQNVDAQLQALLDTIGMKGVGGKKEKRAKEFIRAVMKNESMEERREVHDEPDPHKTTTEDDKNEDGIVLIALVDRFSRGMVSTKIPWSLE